MPEPVDLLVGADVLYLMTEGAPIILDGEVAVRAGRIIHAGPRRPSGTWAAKETLSGRGKAVLPGTEGRRASRSNRLMSPDDPLEIGA